MKRPALSVIVIGFDMARELPRTVTSLLPPYQRGLEIEDVEIIVVDNGSSDGSPSAARQFANVTVICNDTNKGFAAANNIGIRASTGKYICLVNSDVKVLDGCIDTLCRYMNSHPDVGLLGPRILNRDLSLQVSCAELPSLRNLLMQALFLNEIFPTSGFCRTRFMTDFDHNVGRDVEVLSGCFLVARREALDEVGLLDEAFFIYKEDVDWCKRFGDAEWRVRFEPEARAIHYGGASSSAAPARFMVEMEKADLQYWLKHHGRLAQKTAACISTMNYTLRICGWAVLYVLTRGNSARAKTKISGYAECLRWMCVHGWKRRRELAVAPGVPVSKR